MISTEWTFVNFLENEKRIVPPDSSISYSEMKKLNEKLFVETVRYHIGWVLIIIICFERFLLKAAEAMYVQGLWDPIYGFCKGLS